MADLTIDQLPDLTISLNESSIHGRTTLCVKKQSLPVIKENNQMRRGQRVESTGA